MQWVTAGVGITAGCGLLRVAGQKLHGKVGEGGFAVLVVDAPDAVELGVGPLVGWGYAERGGEVGKFAVVPGDEDDLSGELAAEEPFGEAGEVLVKDVVQDGQVERRGERHYGFKGAIAVFAAGGGEEDVGFGEFCAGGGEQVGKKRGAEETLLGEVGALIGRLFGVADEVNGRGGLGGRGLGQHRGTEEGEREQGAAGQDERRHGYRINGMAAGNVRGV